MGILNNMVASRKYWVGGNWKCSLKRDSVETLAKALKSKSESLKERNVDFVVCPSPIHLTLVKNILRDSQVIVGAQNASKTGQGAYTGEVSIEQLKDFDVTTTLLGHSERRTLYGETDQIVADKVKICQEDPNMIAVICIGETLEEREANKVLEVNSRQLKACFSSIKDWNRIVIAYEPVWAIGTGVTATPEQAQTTHKEIRDYIAKEVSSDVANKVRIVYGGSMNANNAAELLACPDIDGGLVGGASLKDSFIDDVVMKIK